MSTLNVSALKNIGAGFTNLLLNSDGSVTLPVYTDASTPPVQFQAGTLWFNGTNLQIRNSANTAWVAVGGGGGGTVTGVAGTAPIVSSGGSAPTISILPATTAAAGSLSAADKVKIDALPLTIVSSVTGSAPIVVATGTTTPAISINAATTSLPGSVQLADAAASQGGTSATLVSTPAFSVPKDASGMTGAAILPSGTDLQRAAIATPVVGMQRFNTDSGYGEIYTGVTNTWRKLAFVSAPNPLPADVTIATGAQTIAPVIQCNNFTVTSGAIITPSTAGTIIIAYGDVTINASTWNFTGTGPVGGPNKNFSSTVFGESGIGYGPGRCINDSGGGISYAPAAFLGGSGGASGSNNNGAAGNSPGGSGGGYILIKCLGSVTFTGAVTMNAAGGNSTAVNDGSGGGGGGGCICIFASDSITSPATVTFNVAGGNASTGSNGFGAGGGGGGWVILETANLVDSSTKTLTGGLGSSSTGNSSSSGGGGGSAGAGGNTSSVTGASGGIGIFATSGFPL